ncbi:hypothetical protein [Coleofasciculus sp. E1-EBD-02]|uniref:hypothetical protein n=1 Tax=Coleofasciculus sp. E1-EBD-02 TaxID=3068481 RepID=UPI0032F9B9AB
MCSLKGRWTPPFFLHPAIPPRITRVESEDSHVHVETTLQTLDRFYREGLMGEMESREQTEEVLAQWQRRLERLWSEVEP